MLIRWKLYYSSAQIHHRLLTDYIRSADWQCLMVALLVSKTIGQTPQKFYWLSIV